MSRNDRQLHSTSQGLNQTALRVYQHATATAEILEILQALEATQQVANSTRSLLISIVHQQQQCVQYIEPSIRSLANQLEVNLPYQASLAPILNVIVDDINNGLFLSELPSTPAFEARAFDWKKQDFYQAKYDAIVHQYSQFVEKLRPFLLSKDDIPPDLLRCEKLADELKTLAGQFIETRKTLHWIFTNLKKLEARLKKIKRYGIVKKGDEGVDLRFR